jgi:hypothetical protein
MSHLLAPLSKLAQLTALVVDPVDNDTVAGATLAQLSGLRELRGQQSAPGLLALTQLLALMRLFCAYILTDAPIECQVRLGAAGGCCCYAQSQPATQAWLLALLLQAFGAHNTRSLAQPDSHPPPLP